MRSAAPSSLLFYRESLTTDDGTQDQYITLFSAAEKARWNRLLPKLRHRICASRPHEDAVDSMT